jgi:DNA-binding transcriptional ArsR family regulator
MRPTLDAEILDFLEEQVAFHREQEAAHEAQEKYHRGQRARHATSLQRASSRLERAKAAVSGRASLPAEPTQSAPAREDAQDTGQPPKVSWMVARVVESWPADSQFGATAVAAEIGRRFGYEVTPSAVSVKLRRLRDRGSIRAAREGQSHVESLFEKS